MSNIVCIYILIKKKRNRYDWISLPTHSFVFIVEQQNNKPAKKEIIRPENEKTSKADACRKTSRLLCLILCKNVDNLAKWKKS